MRPIELVALLTTSLACTTRDSDESGIAGDATRTTSSQTSGDDGGSGDGGSGDDDGGSGSGASGTGTHGSGSGSGASGTGTHGSDSGSSTTGGGSTTSSTGVGSTGGSTESLDCTELGEASCVAAEQCGPIHGRPFEGDGVSEPYCLGDSVFLECMFDVGCGDMETIACNEDDEAWWFSSTCIPTSFIECEDPSGGTADLCP